ncbi:MAG: AAA family ATPase [Candidatus Aenigmarchaeota archaeon]|nr:AAA family ATPase [Candidatus Aenigmarchaeota archaeon]
MLLKSIRLKNIRSYTDEDIDFPLGSSMLSGDVGSGKSTILLAMDFGLFGLRKGELEGTDLLRHGKDRGSVTIIFEIDGKEVEITRTLRRANSVTQDSGTIVIDGKQQELMPVELKSKVLELFGYSQEILKKNRPIFRYTVYTPQEKMKDILFDAEVRLATLRKIFSTDKYGIIKSNTKLFVSELRSMKRENEVLARDLEAKLAEKQEKETERERLLVLVDRCAIEVSAIDSALGSKQERFESVRKKMNEISSLRRDIARLESELRVKESRLPKIAGDLDDMTEKISLISISGEEIDVAALKAQIADMEEKKEKIIRENAVVSSEFRRLNSILKDGICSFCNQPVSRGDFQRHLDERARILDELKKNMDFINAGVTKMRESLSKGEKIQYEKRLLEEYKRQCASLESEKKSLSSDIVALQSEIGMLADQAGNEDEIARAYSEVQEEISAINRSKIAAEKEKARCEQQLFDTDRFLKSAEKEISEKRLAKEKILYINELMNWLDSYFTALMDIIEKHVMSAIQSIFNEFFQKWFGIIMGEQMSVRIDENFSPVIEQNGYVTDYTNLSGGEKTAVALAYRLALNRVINSMIESIKTKDILILDEPTDGFSSDQLDRIRDIIAELQLRQLILVSHEPKIDTFVDNVIKVYKEEHVSKIVY